MENYKFTNEEKDFALDVFNDSIKFGMSLVEQPEYVKIRDNGSIPQKKANELVTLLCDKGILPFFYSEEELEVHPHGRIITAFYNTLREWYKVSDGDCSYACGFGDSTLFEIRSNFGISRDEVILFERDTSFWSNNNQGLVIHNLPFLGKNSIRYNIKKHVSIFIMGMKN